MTRRQTRATRTDTLFPYTTLFRSACFRRTQHLAYRPACVGCTSCVPVRLRVTDFRWTRGHRRVLKTNADLTGEAVPNEATREQFDLFRSEEHTSELQSLMRISYAVFCLKKKKKKLTYGKK